MNPFVFVMKNVYRFVLTILSLVLYVHAVATPTDRTRDSLEQVLSTTTSYPKKIVLLRNLSDISEKNNAYKYYQEMLELGRSHHDLQIQLEAIRLYGNCGSVDTLNHYIRLLMTFPVCHSTQEVTTFLHIQRAYLEIGVNNGKSKAINLHRLITEYKKDKRTNIYSKIDKLFTICISLSSNSENEQYKSYLKQLEQLINALPADGRNVLPNAYMVYAANFYSNNGTHREAVDAFMNVVQMLKQLEQECKREGRIYRHFDEVYYQTYTSILSHYVVLSQAQIYDIYNKIKKIALHNKTINTDLYSPYSIARIRFYMGIKDYRLAAFYLKKYFKAYKQYVYQKECLEYAIEAAQKINDKDLLIKSSLAYINVLKKNEKEKLAQKAKELQVIYNVNALQQQVSQTSIDKQKGLYDASIKISRIYLFLLVVSIVFLLFTTFLVRKYKKTAYDLEKSTFSLKNEQIILSDTMKKLMKARDEAESANRMKTMFLQNMNHEIRTPLNVIVGFSELLVKMRGEISKEEEGDYIALIQHNSDLLLSLINDVLDIARMESGEMNFTATDFSLNELCRMALESIRHRGKSGVKMLFKPHEKDVVMHTDKQRVDQVITNYLSNAAKFTQNGQIILDYDVDNQNKKVIISVTDTGIGVPEEKARVIFQRFEKLDNFAQGTGLGLHICSLIANRLNGEVCLDTNYKEGARFLFILPLEPVFS